MRTQSIPARAGNPGRTLLFLTLVLGAVILFPSSLLAQNNYTLGTGDAGGTSSLTGTTNWFPSGAPAPNTIAAASDTYTVGPFGAATALRTPTGSGNYTIYANPMTLDTDGVISFKGYGNYTFNNLVLNGGYIQDGATASPGGSNLCYIYGSINLIATSQIRGGNNVGGIDFIYAAITNDASVVGTPTLQFTSGEIIQLCAQNTFSGNLNVLSSSPSTILQLGINNATPATASLTLNAGSNYAIFDLNGFSTTLAGLSMSGGTDVGFVTNSAAGKTSTLIISNNASSSQVNGLIADNPGTGGTIALTEAGTAGLTLNNAMTYHGNTTISAGTLTLFAAGSITNTPNIFIAAGATLDVSAFVTNAWSTHTTLNASGTGSSQGANAATINGQSGGAVSLGSQPVMLTFTPTAFTGDTTHPSLLISQGDLTLNNNAFTVNNASGTALGAGTYELIQVNDSNVNQNSTPSYALTVTGSGIAAHTTAAIQVSGGNVNLVVTANANPTPTFSNLTASPTVAYGTASVTLGGRISSGGIYPVNGEPVTVTIDGNIQATSINDSTGDFSISYNLSGIPASGTPYTITYSYGGDGSLGSAANTSTTLTINKATPVFSGLTTSQTISYGTAAVTLGGTLSVGSVYPASGETVTVTVDGFAQNTTISDSTGDFSIGYSPTNLPEAAATYPITYSFAGDASLNSASDSSTSLTVETNTFTENQISSDSINNSSLTVSTNWTPATTVYPTSPQATNYNFITATSLRTPPGSSAYPVYAQSLTIEPTGFLVFKGSGLVTISDLILNGGDIKNAGTLVTPDEAQLAGYINLTASSSLTPNSQVTSIINIASVITNAPGISPTLTCSAGGTVILSGQNTFNGSIVVTGAAGLGTILQLGVNNALPAGANLTLNGGAGTTGPGVFDLNGYNTTITNLNISVTGPNYAFVTNSAPGTTGTLTLGNGNTSETLQNGAIVDNPATAGTVALAKIGTGTLTLNNNYAYDGNTTISAGTLALGGSGSIPNSAEIYVASNAVFDVSSQGTYTVGNTQTLGGGGTVNNSVQANGPLAPSGTLTINGSLNVNGNLIFTLNKSLAQSNDIVSVSGSLNNTGTGTLTVNNLGPILNVGDKFTLFNQPLSGGDTLSIVPPAGVVLTNNLDVDGSVSVLSVTDVTSPVITGISLSGTNLIVTGTNGYAGASFNVLTTTNLALPLTSWTVLPTNTFGGANFSVTNPVNASTPQKFYILRVP